MLNIVLSTVGTALAILWIMLYAKAGSKYDGLIEQIDGNEYFAKDFFGIGFSAIEMFKVDMNSAMAQKKAEKLSEMYRLPS